MPRTKRAIGMMSGTSMDGVDAAFIETDGHSIARLGPTAFRPYSDDERSVVAKCMASAIAAGPDTKKFLQSESVQSVVSLVSSAHTEAVAMLLEKLPANDSGIDVIGFHGQTVIHRPDKELTIQLGDAQELANRTGTEVVFDLRQADIKAGGQGAPLVPVYHRALAELADLPKPAAIVNIGGVANVTWIGALENELVAFDTGPGNVLVDEFIKSRTGERMDIDGKLAAAGKVDDQILAEMLGDPYFEKVGPKSLDRYDFSADQANSLRTEDGAATLTAFTAESLNLAANHFPAPVNQWVITGGGALNPTMMAMLRDRLESPVLSAADLGWKETFIEAQAFGFLAVRSIYGLPITWPGTTGAPQPMTGGICATPTSR